MDINATRSNVDDNLMLAVTREPEITGTVPSAEDELLKKKKSTFRYELDEQTGTQKPFSKCSYGIYYTAAERLTEEREQNEQEEREREKNEQGHFKCVIMNCGEDVCHVISQIKSFREMGNEYALEVIHIDNTDRSNVKVIYPHFENTLSKWLEKLDIPKETDEDDQWMQYKVFPKIRKLWQILLKMKNNERNINKPYCLPLIDGMPKLLYIPEEDDGQREREPEDYPIEVFNTVLGVLQRSGKRSKLPDYIGKAREFWKDKPSKSELLRHYPLLNIHPVLYNSHEKSKFLQLFFDVRVEYKLDPWLNKEMDWPDFQERFKGAKKREVYEKTFNHEPQKRQSPAHNHAQSDQETRSSPQGSESYETKNPKRQRIVHYASSSSAPDQEQSNQEFLSSSQGQSNQKTSNYHRGSDIVRFTRNVLAHFNDNHKNPQGGRLAGDEIVEIVDRDLAVCSLYYTNAEKIIADQAWGENGKKAKKKLAEFLESLK